MTKKTISEEISAFFDVWDSKDMVEFFSDLMPLFILYNVDLDEKDWVVDEVGIEDAMNVRIIQTAYLLTKFAEKHSAKLCSMKIRFKDLPKRLENHVQQ